MSQYEISIPEYWRILKKRKVIIFSISVLLGVFSTFSAILRAPAPLYNSVCSIKFQKNTPVEGVYSRTIFWSEDEDIETQISTIKSYLVLQKVAEALQLISPDDVGEGNRLKSSVINVVRSLQSKVSVTRESVRVGATRERFTNILNISVTDRDPAFAQKLANTISLTYRELHSEQQMRRTTEALKYISKQLRDVRQKLRNAEDEFNRFSQANQLISIDLQSETLLTWSQDLQNEILKLQQEDEKELEDILRELRQFVEQPNGARRTFYSTKADRQYQDTNDSLVELMLKRDTLLKDYTMQHPEVIAISREIMEKAQKLVILLQLQLRAVERRRKALEQEMEKIGRKTSLLMEKKLEFNRLKRKVELFNNMTILLEQKNQEALIRKADKPEEVLIVKPAFLPTSPINPPKTATTGAMGIIIGLVVGLIIAFVMETFDTSLGAIDEVEELLGTTVLGIIPQMGVKEVQELLREKYPEASESPAAKQMVYLLSHFAPLSTMAESFRALRTNIQFKGAVKKIKTVAITSTSPQEGKTLVSINLAVTMAQAGMKTLLVGADLRMPKLGPVFGLERGPGLADILLENCPWRKTVKNVTDIMMGKLSMTQVIMTSGLENLHLITAGAIPPNPAELIDSERFRDFVEDVKKEFDILLFDTTPILPAADAAILGTKVDSVLLVYRMGKVSRSLLKRSTTQLEQVDCDIMGVVLNGMKPELSPDFHDYKYSNYSYSHAKQGTDDEMEGRPEKRLFSFSRKKEERQMATVSKRSPGRIKKGGPGGKKRPYLMRLIIFAIGFTFLAMGILWQNGLWSPFEQKRPRGPINKNKMETSSGRGILSRSLPKKAEATPQNPKEPFNPFTPKFAEAVPIEVDRKAKVSQKRPKSEIKPLPPLKAKGEKMKSYPYSLYLGSFKTLKRAKRAVSQYSRNGRSAYWAKVHLSKGIWFRVFTGYFENRHEAEKFKRAHGLKEGEVKETAYANLIGVYTASEELDQPVRSMKKLGFSPYVIKDHEKKLRLFVGAFFPRGRAERLRDDLKSVGIENRVVRR